MQFRSSELACVILCCVILFCLSTATFAQVAVTSTPAPSKTPLPTATTTPVQDLATEAPTATTNPIDANNPFQLARSFNQSDLNILVGNVQRPNGLYWFDENLYSVCSGDFTIYQIDSSTGMTVTFTSGVRDANTILIEETENGFNLWVPDFDTNQVLVTSHLATLPRPVISDNLDGPWGIAAIGTEHFLVTNALSDTIVLAGRDGTSHIAADGFRYPTGIVVDDDRVYVANRGSARRAIEWFGVDEISAETTSSNIGRQLVNGLQNVSNLLIAPDGYLYFTYALAERGVVGRVDPDLCRENGCTNEQVEIVILTDGRTAPLAGLTISEDMRLFVHTVYNSEIFWVQLYDDVQQ